MTHRAEQILTAAAEAIATEVSGDGVNVFTHRRESLAEDQGELPAISVDFGDDTPGEESTPPHALHSLLEVRVTGVVAFPTEVEVKEWLLRLRRSVHIAMMTDRTLGLEFVVVTRYGGAAEPEIEVLSEVVAGALTTAWFVHYRMNTSDPGD